MINKQKNNGDSKKILTLIILIGVLMVTTTGATYAYFALTVSNTTTVTGTAATTGLSLSVTEAALKSSNTGVMVPQLSTAVGTAMTSSNQCVDGNGNIVCKVYTITVTNSSTSNVVVNGTIKFTATTAVSTGTTNLKWKRVAATQSAGTSTTGSYSDVSATTAETDLISGTACTPSSSSSGCTDVALGKSTASNKSQTYYIVVWINETGSAQTDSGTWKATIKFEGDNGKGVTSTITS